MSVILATACGTAGPSLGPGDARTAVPAPSTSATQAPPPIVRDLAGIQAALDRTAGAMRTGDVDAVRDVLADPGSDFGERWQQRAENMGALPLSTYELEVDEVLGDLTTASVRERFEDPVQVVAVTERHALVGFDATGPAEEVLFLTVVERADDWFVAGDDDAERLGLVSVDHLWDLGPVVLSDGDRVQALHHPGTSDIDVILAQAEAAVDEISARWPLAWPERVPVIIPATQDELGELLHVTFDLSNFVAFATATPVGELGSYQLTGVRIVVNPERFLDRAPAARMRTLLHELQHVATREVAGPFVPNWLEEGLAQVLGEERSTTGTRLLDAVVDGELDLPRDGEFTGGGRDRIFLSYQLAWGFVDWLIAEFGTDRVADFYVAIGDERDAPGTEPWHINDAALEVFNATVDELVERWAASR